MQYPEKNMVAFVTRENIDWALEFTGYSREELEKFLDDAEAEDVVCVVKVKR